MYIKIHGLQLGMYRILGLQPRHGRAAHIGLSRQLCKKGLYANAKLDHKMNLQKKDLINSGVSKI
jgi:hypothetical protein